MNGYKVVVTKSTVPTGTGRMIEQIIREKNGRHDFSVVSNPEFLREGSAIDDFLRPDRIVIGANDPRAVDVLREIYAPLYLIETPFLITDVASAELIKYASNGFLAVKISFINEIAQTLRADGRGRARRGQGHGARPAHRLEVPPSRARLRRLLLPQGHGGRGRSRPPAGLRVRDHRGDHAASTRRRRPACSTRSRRPSGRWPARRAAMLGLSFKPETDDIRESPALSVLEGLEKAGAKVRAFDPAAMANARALYPDVALRPRRLRLRRRGGLPRPGHGVERVPGARPRRGSRAPADPHDDRPAQRLRAPPR